jgi:methylenetetrahydrofolate dehydrogenase (NAD+)
MEGKTVTIINRSEIVGRPLGALLANDGEVAQRFFNVCPLTPSVCVHSHPLYVRASCDSGADIYSVDIDSIFLFKRGVLHKTEISTEEAVRASDVVVAGKHTTGCKVVYIAVG